MMMMTMTMKAMTLMMSDAQVIAAEGEKIMMM